MSVALFWWNKFGPLAQQSGRERTLAIPTTRAGDVAVPTSANAPEVRLGTCLGPQLFPTERQLQNRHTCKQTRAAALAKWRGLLAA
jgi:hypothetical protein